MNVRVAHRSDRNSSVPPRVIPRESTPPRAARPTGLARQRTPFPAGRFMALWSVAVLATAAAFVAHLALRFETVRLGYDVGHARRSQRGLVEQRRILSLEAATLRQAARVETVARGSLNMDVPDSTRVIPIQARDAVRTAGRIR